MVNSKIQAAEENLIHVYNRFPIALDHGEGMYLYDTEGKDILTLQQNLLCLDLDMIIKN